MDAATYTLIGTLGGVIVGAAAGFAETYYQQSRQDKRDRLKMAVDLGLAQYKESVAYVQATKCCCDPARRSLRDLGRKDARRPRGGRHHPRKGA